MISRPLYLNIEDTLAEVGITRRQLGHWQEKGLLVPQLGADARRYTVPDLERLKVLKRLIVDQQFPLEFVKQLADRADDGVGSPLGATQYLDIDASEMRSKDELSEELWNDFLVQANDTQLTERLSDLWLVLARVLRAGYRTDASYTNRKNEIWSNGNNAEFAGRIDFMYAKDGTLRPTLDPFLEEERYSDDELINWLKAFRDRIGRIQKHADAAQKADRLNQEGARRFWSDEMFELMKDESFGNFDDVPF